jgi:hypothetical protein
MARPHAQLTIALEATDQYDFSGSIDYRFVSQEIICLLPLLHISHFQYLMDIVVSEMV